MKNARIFLLAATFSALQNVDSQAQTYITAIGLRADRGLGVSLQQYIGNRWTLEVIGHSPFRTKELGITALGERHHKLLVRNLNFYYGGGGHYYWKSTDGKDMSEIHQNVFGLTGIGGAELSLGRLNFAVDFKPELHFTGNQVHPFEWPGAAVSVRYILEKRSRFRKIDFDDFQRRKKKHGRG